MEKYKDRHEKRKVTETMNALLLPMSHCLNSDTAIIVNRALYLLGEIEIEEQKEHQCFNDDTMDAYMFDYDNYDIDCCQ